MWARCCGGVVAALALACCLLARGASGACGVAQFPCRAARCVPLSAYCDGTPHCPDASDEPPGCTPCNRTYYGLTGRAYEMALPPPTRLPFLCQLTFTAGGGALGDLVQLGFEKFAVGRYSAGAREPCPDGAAQLAELGRPFTGGSWCGEAAGPAVYYSETATVTLSLRLAAGALALRLRYRFLAAREAIVRFGPAAAPVERGAAAPGTYCTRTYEECHRRSCRLQSPNYPGMYPRNVTCYWSLRQKDVPTCKHAMISVRQEHAHKMQIKRSISMASLNKTGRAVRAWRECTGERDRLIVYDGGSTDDPVLLEYCGGDWLPPVTSRGPDMLVAFHSSPYSAPPRAPAPGSAAPGLRGFELDVAVVFADSDSLEYAREPRRCEFHVKAGAGDEARGRRGVLRAPRHTLPPGAACTWTFHGRPGDRVWVYFASYTHYSLAEPRRDVTAGDEQTDLPPDAPAPHGRGAAGVDAAPAGWDPGGRTDSSPWARLRELMRSRAGTTPAPAPAPAPPGPTSCDTELRIWDGPAEGAVPLARYCDTAPALCARASLANATRAPRACAPPDGYVSAGTMLSLALRTARGTATHPLRFALHYEFVDARLPGALLEAGRGAGVGVAAVPPECARELTSPGPLWAPRAVLWLGRGGARRLRCVYRLTAVGDARRVRMRLGNVTLGREPRCFTQLEPRTGLLTCVPHDKPPMEAEADADDDERGEGVGVVDDSGELPAGAEPSLKVPHLWIYESPWPGVKVPVACVCDNTTTSLEAHGAGALELRLSAARLLPDEDQRHLQFNGSWSVEETPAECLPLVPPPPGGHVHLPPAACPRAVLLRARPRRSVFLRVWGEELPPPAGPAAVAAAAPAPSEPPPCHTQDRVLVYDPHTGRLLKAICPGDTSEAARSVQLFSAEWWGASAVGVGAAGAHGGWLVVSVSARAGPVRLAWLEVRRAETLGDNVTCPHACPELGACTAGALWCDGAADCPRGGDEAGGCGAARLLAALSGWQAGAAAGAGAAALLLLLLVLALRRARSRKRPPPDLAAPRRLTQEPLLESRPASAAS